jgi:hypothetical protein
MPIGQFLVAHAKMLDEIRAFRYLSIDEQQKAMLDLLEVIEGEGMSGPEARCAVEELLTQYKKWKFGVDGRYERVPRSGERGPTATLPFVNVRVVDAKVVDVKVEQSAPGPSNPVSRVPELEGR